MWPSSRMRRMIPTASDSVFPFLYGRSVAVSASNMSAIASTRAAGISRYAEQARLFASALPSRRESSGVGVSNNTKSQLFEHFRRKTEVLREVSAIDSSDGQLRSSPALASRARARFAYTEAKEVPE